MKSWNVNIDPSAAPSWLVLLMLVATFAAEVLERDASGPPALTADECRDLCGQVVESYSPTSCVCRKGCE